MTHPLLPFQDWLSTSLGATLAEMEQQTMLDLLTTRFYPNAVQLGSPQIDVVGGVNCRNAISLGVPGDLRRASVTSELCPVPFGGQTFDLLVLPHTLDFASDPYQLLREYTQMMVSDGYLILSGFQPFSLWGASRLLKPVAKRQPWAGNFYSVNRVQDWLLLLGYQIRSGTMLMYRPPINNQAAMTRLALMEKAGNRWWPMLGSVYIILARLKTLRVLPVGMKARRARIKSGFAQPVASKIPTHQNRTHA